MSGEPQSAIWKRPYDLLALNRFSAATAVSHLGIEFVDVGPDWLSARIPVDARTRQPYGLLHGGCTVVLAETLGSTGAVLTLPPEWMAVGVEINANHLRALREGHATGTARPLHRGRSTQVWEIRVVGDTGELVCVSRITLAVVPVKRTGAGGAA